MINEYTAVGGIKLAGKTRILEEDLSIYPPQIPH
jgi:hypothetical protein